MFKYQFVGDSQTKDFKIALFSKNADNNCTFEMFLEIGIPSEHEDGRKYCDATLVRKTGNNGLNKTTKALTSIKAVEEMDYGGWIKCRLRIKEGYLQLDIGKKRLINYPFEMERFLNQHLEKFSFGFIGDNSSHVIISKIKFI